MPNVALGSPVRREAVHGLHVPQAPSQELRGRSRPKAAEKGLRAV